MSILHMDVEANRALVKQIRNTTQTCEQQFSQLFITVNSTIGSSWISPTATEFENSFQECSMDFRRVLENLEALSMRLQNEISEWEQAASKLS